MGDIIKDYDKLTYPKRIAILGGQKIDVTIIPSRTALEVAIFRDRIFRIKSEDSFNDLIEIVARICRLSNDKITSEWLLDNTHVEELNDFLTFVLEPINKRASSPEGKKK
jgi:hypothetical protein